MYNETPEQVAGAFDFSNFDKLSNGWSHYEGYFRDDRKEGEGVLYLTNGEKIEANFLNDFINGTGLFFSLFGKVYQGTWVYNRLVSTPVLKSLPELASERLTSENNRASFDLSQEMIQSTTSNVLKNEDSLHLNKNESSEGPLENNGFNFNFDYDVEEVKEETKADAIHQLAMEVKLDTSSELKTAEKKPLEEQLQRNAVGNFEIEEVILKQYSSTSGKKREDANEIHDTLSSSYCGSDSFISGHANNE